MQHRGIFSVLVGVLAIMTDFSLFSLVSQNNNGIMPSKKRSNIIRLPVKKTEMGRTCGTYGGEERCIQGFSGET